MKHNTAAATAAFAGAALLFAVCPPAGIGYVAATLTAGLGAGIGAIFAAKAAGNVLTQKQIEAVKKSLAHPAVLSQMQKRVRKLYKFAARAGIVANVGAFVALGALVGAAFAPSLALPLLYNLGMAAFGGGVLATVAVGDAKKSATELNEVAKENTVTPAAPANEDAATGPVRVLPRMASLKKTFGGVSAPDAQAKPKALVLAYVPTPRQMLTLQA